MIKRIPVRELQLGMYIHKLDVSRQVETSLRSGILLTQSSEISAIIGFGVKHVWIDPDKTISMERKIAPSPAVNGQEDDLVLNAMNSAIENARRICLSGTDQMKRMFSEVRLGKTIDPLVTLPLVDEIIHSLQHNPTALLNIARLKTHDEYTYQHSVSVCALMISLGRQYQLSDEALRLVGMGGLLHDLGKALVPSEILTKPGRLTQTELLAMQQHPLLGAAMLRAGATAPELQDIVLHHHEKMDGTGYPFGLKGEEISLYSRMAAVCDVYDALTSNRAYKDAWNPAAAMRKMASWENHFDRQVFFAFVKSVGIYPVGSVVRLSSERLAVVTETGQSSLLQPKVRIFYSLRTNEPLPVQMIDLSMASVNDSIIGPEENNDWNNTNISNLWM